MRTFRKKSLLLGTTGRGTKMLHEHALGVVTRADLDVKEAWTLH